jgi:hypothetical protein
MVFHNASWDMIWLKSEKDRLTWHRVHSYIVKVLDLMRKECFKNKRLIKESVHETHVGYGRRINDRVTG